MFKKSLWFGSIALVLMALFALNACSSDDGGSAPAVEEDPSLQGDLGGIRPGAPVHNVQAQTVITGTNAVARITWNEGVSGGVFRYNDGTAVKAEAVITANSDYVFDKSLRESDILTAFGNVTSDIDDEWTISEDYTEFSFTFSYAVGRAQVPQADIAEFRDLVLVAGSSALPDYLDRPIEFAGIKEASRIAWYAAAADTEASDPPPATITAIPAAGTGFQAKIELEAKYGYSFDGFDPAVSFPGADRILNKKTALSAENNVKLSFVLYYTSGLNPISALTGLNQLFASTPAAGQKVPGELRTAFDANFSVTRAEWTTDNLVGDVIAFGGTPISISVELTPKKGYTFASAAATPAIPDTAVQTAFTITGTGAIPAPANAANPNVPLVEVIDRSHKLAFTLSYNVAYVAILPDDLTSLKTSGATGLSPLKVFRAPRIGQPVQKAVDLHTDARFTNGAIIWSDAAGNPLGNNYGHSITIAAITLEAKPGFLFSSLAADISGFGSTIGTIFNNSNTTLYGNPTVTIVGTPGRTLEFTLQYTTINPPLSASSGGSSGSVIVDNALLNSGGGLEELFEAISGNTVTISKGTGPITLTTPPVIPTGKNLELASDAEVTTSLALDAQGDLSLGTGGKLTASGGSAITGNVTLGQNSEVSLSGAATTIGGNVSFAQDSKLALSGTAATIGDSTGKATALAGPAGAPPAPIDLTAGTLNLIGNVTATSVTITSNASSKIDIPAGTGALTLGTDASLVLNPGGNAASPSKGSNGTLNGKVVVKAGAAIIDTSPDLTAWDVGPNGEIEIQKGGYAVMNGPSPYGIDTYIGTADPAEQSYSKYIQLADDAVFTIKYGEYEVTTGKITLATNFGLDSKITVKGELTLAADLTFLSDLSLSSGSVKKLVGTDGAKLIVGPGKSIRFAFTDVTEDIAEDLAPGIDFEAANNNVSSYTNSSGTDDVTFTWNTTTNKWETE
jgi:hypothetical protein